MRIVESLVLLLALVLAPTGGALAAYESQRDDPELRLALIEAIQDSTTFVDRYDAEVWLVDMSTRLQRKVPDPATRVHLLKLVHYEATRVALPPELVLAVIDVESNFDPWAISSAGAQGLMQVMPFWLEELGRSHESLHRPEINLRLGCTILRYYLDMERGNLRAALARYNGSVGRSEYTDRVLGALRVRWYRK
jgi:soluble lytic murein transglycosylase-like protein